MTIAMKKKTALDLASRKSQRSSRCQRALDEEVELHASLVRLQGHVLPKLCGKWNTQYQSFVVYEHVGIAVSLCTMLLACNATTTADTYPLSPLRQLSDNYGMKQFNLSLEEKSSYQSNLHKPPARAIHQAGVVHCDI